MDAQLGVDEHLRALSRAAGARAIFRDVSAWGVERITRDVADLDDGFHVVVQTFEGDLVAASMEHVVHHPRHPWLGAHALDDVTASLEAMPEGLPGWSSSLSQRQFEHGVERIRDFIAHGDVYQVNLCRTLALDLAAAQEWSVDLDALFRGVLAHNPARHAARIDIAGLPQIVSASPETYLSREGARLSSAPIKGTAVSAERMLAKDVTENVMITDLVRNDLQRVCEPGTVAVEGLLSTEQHPGLVHLVSTVVGTLHDGVSWAQILDATGPPGSVSGTPKHRALEVITELEPVRRGPYCGAIGWIDATDGVELQRADLAVGIRTFWRDDAQGLGMPSARRLEAPRTQVVAGVPTGSRPLGSQQILFGVGAGITWDSQARAEWDETELKAHRLLAIAAGALRRRQA